MNIAILVFLAASAMRPGGDMRDVSMRFDAPVGGGDTLTLDAPAYTRTVTASSYTLTGTSVGSGAVSWAASPSGASGSCTGTDTFSCDVTVTPDATGEGVEVITVTRGAASDTETLGFYVAGAHSVFLAQNVDGDYNSTLSDLDAVATWQNVGTSGLDVTQGTGAAQPTFRTGIVGGQPVVRCDGGDRVVAAAAADWTFLHDGNGSTIDVVLSLTNTALNTIASTGAGSAGSRGVGFRTNTTALAGYYMSDGTALRINATSANNIFTINTFNGHLVTLASADTPDASVYINGTSVANANAAAFSALAPALPFAICALSSGVNPTTGDVFRLLAYPSSLTSTQRGINKAVDEWALGGTLPVTP